jgi:hypothetical protein
MILRPALLVVVLLAVACGGRAEEVVLRGYFDTCAVADEVTLANLALVTLDPHRDGVVGHFRVVSVDPQVQQPAAAHPRAVHLSLLDPQRRHDERTAVLATESVQLRAEIHREGAVSEQPMTVTLARARTSDTVGRWIVVRLVLAGRTLPEASSVQR